jgi:hypothetical protein
MAVPSVIWRVRKAMAVMSWVCPRSISIHAPFPSPAVDHSVARSPSMALAAEKLSENSELSAVMVPVGAMFGQRPASVTGGVRKVRVLLR